MLYTAVAIATTGELGISRGQTFALPRAGGDAVSPYGMGLPLLEVPVALLAGPWEARFGARTSQTLLVLLQVLLVTAGAAKKTAKTRHVPWSGSVKPQAV